MKAQTLAHIKKQLAKLANVVECYSNLSDGFPIYVTIRVALRNAGSNFTNCVNYDHKEEVEELYLLQAFLKTLSEYEKDNHFISYINSEVYMIIKGNEMSEDEVCDECGGVDCHTTECSHYSRSEYIKNNFVGNYPNDDN